MRIAFLCKRQYMRKDVLDDRYGRLYELPCQLARRGHSVLGVCLSYRPRPEGCLIREADFEWHSFNLGRWILPGFLRYRRAVVRLMKAFRPDILIGASDSPHVVFAAHLARRLDIPYAVDLYDNFESFGLSRLPGLIPLYRRALRNARSVSCVSQALADYVTDSLQPSGQVMAIESAVDTGLFTPLDRELCRRRLGLPSGVKLIGTAGALSENRGIDVLYEAYARLAKRDSAIHLALAGAPTKKCPVPKGDRVHFLGTLDHDQMPWFFNALDVAVIPMLNSDFGRYAFPQKLYEILACQVPVIVAAVGAMKALLADHPECLYEPDNPDELARQLCCQLATPQNPTLAIPDWAAQAALLERSLSGAVMDQSDRRT
jgi:teichuronic acid biosynthesis glycosyltransferase TuaC